MLPFGHASASYLISQTPRLKNQPLKREEVWLVVLTGMVLDLDFFVPYFFGLPGGLHHFFPTHTPLAVVLYLSLLFLIFQKRYSRRALVLAGVAAFAHLVLDDFSYWLTRLGLEKGVGPQISWLYPFDPRMGPVIEQAGKAYSAGMRSNVDILKIYLFQAPTLFYLEITLCLAAILVLVKARR